MRLFAFNCVLFKMWFDGLITPTRLWAVQATAVALAAAYVGSSAASVAFGPLGVLLCCAVILSQALVPRFPVVALCAFVIAAGVLPRYGQDNLAMLKLGLLNWLAALGLAGWMVWLARTRIRPPLSNSLLVAMALFIAWGGVALLTAPAQMPAGGYSAKHHPEQYLQAAVLMVIASTLLADRAAGWLIALLMCLIPIARGLLQSDAGVYLDADVAALAVLGLPFALSGLSSSLPWWQRLSLAAIAVELMRIILVAQNRGAAIGLALVIFALWMTSRYRLRWLLGAAPILLAAAFFVPRSYMDRFSVLWNTEASHATASLDRATVEHRLQLWSAGVRIVREHPWLGVGPGNYPKALATYLPDSEGFATHNSLLSVAAETGLIGAAIFGFLFLGAIVLLQRLIRAGLPGWRRETARAVQASLAGYLGVGLVISRQDMQIAYLLLGWTVALMVAMNGRSRVAQQSPSG